jgi:DNA (cytosine-5)-methyltransferase 1
VCGDLENLAYAVGFNHIEAASAGADHRRDRIFFVADNDQSCASEGWQQRSGQFGGAGGDSQACFMGNASGTGLAQRECERGVLREVGGESQGQDTADDGGSLGDTYRIPGGQRGAINGWSDQGSGAQSRTGLGGTDGCGWIIGHDGKARRVPESGIRLLADGIPARVGKLRALGNAIDPRPAAAFITAYMQARGLISNQKVA